MAQVLVINKEKDMTSRDVVNIVSKKYKTRAVGHTGTLDPLATGVLVICLNESTKLVPFLTSLDKEYEATIILGYTTDTLDITGTKTIEKEINNITDEDIFKVINNFPRQYQQEVPIYSAIKVNGKKLYEYAREGIAVELPTKSVSINSLVITSDIMRENNLISFKIKTSVSKGTYIRSLIRDIGEALNVPAVMATLVRTKQGDFSIEDTISIEEIGVKETKLDILSFLNLDKRQPTIEELTKIRNGSILDIESSNDILFYNDNEIIAVYEPYHKDPSKIKPVRVFNNIKRVD